jgi:uncharacterized phage infection (PIP) family protein YhgE
MTNKPTKKKKPTEKLNNISPEYDSVREQNVLLIDMHKDIRLVVEQHTAIVTRLDTIESELNTVKVATLEDSHRIKALEIGQKELKAGQAKLEQGQANLKSDVERLKAGQEKLEQGQERIEQKLDVVTLDHEQRLTKLEAVR